MTLLANESLQTHRGIEATILVQFWVAFHGVHLQMRSNLFETLINDAM